MARFTAEFLDELKSRLRPSDVVGRHVKLRKQGSEWAGLSPFTKEKTPSFFVNDQKGFYHCFSSGNHGDIIKFLQETQKLTFAEAVTRLAEEAGMPLPKDNPHADKNAEQRLGIAEANAAAARFFAQMLRRSDGREALEYLRRRGVVDAQIDAFGIGYAPGANADLKDFLINKGFSETALIDAGLIAKPDDGRSAFDRFRNRIMFPIAGRRGEIIAFGGRALDKDARAKYLNSPETALFHKGDSLYNYESARTEAAKSGHPLVVAEGYMDVIALWGAGRREAVAPLGTALSERQLALLWRTSDEPVLCFDGDRAGQAAAFRAIDRALPLLKPGKSLRFVFLPDGRDPDDLIRESGPDAIAAALSGARPLAEVLWRRETEARDLDTPERRAALRAHLRGLIAQIADRDVRAAYETFMREKLAAQFAPPGRREGGNRRPEQFREGRGSRPGAGAAAFRPEPRPTEDLLRLGAPSGFEREATLVLAAIRHPALVDRRESAFLALNLENPKLSALLSEALQAIFANPALDSSGLCAHLRLTAAAEMLERLLSDQTLNTQSFLRPDAPIHQVEAGWDQWLRSHLFGSTARQDVTESARGIHAGDGEAWKAMVNERERIRSSGEGACGDGDETVLEARRNEELLDRIRAQLGRKHN